MQDNYHRWLNMQHAIESDRVKRTNEQAEQNMKHYIVITVETMHASSPEALVNEIASNLQSVATDYGIVSATVANGGAVDKHYHEPTVSFTL